MKKNLLIVLMICAITAVITSCVGVVGPEPPPDPNEKVEYYDYIVTYIRPQGSIVRPERSDPPVVTFRNKDLVIQHCTLTKINDYEFTATIVGVPTHLKKEQGLPANIINITDCKRWVTIFDDGALLWGDPFTFGEIFKLKNRTTGSETTLTNIIPNTFVTGLPAGNSAKVAQFWTLKGGIAVNEWPSQ